MARTREGHELLTRADHLPYEIPTRANRLREACCKTGAIPEEEMLAFAKGTRPIVHPRSYSLISYYLRHKQEQGTRSEREVYGRIDVGGFFERLLRLRPLSFVTKNDEFLLRDGRTRGYGTQGTARFDYIGTSMEQDPLVFEKYQSYAEMELSSLLGISGQTQFVNAGGVTNRGIAGQAGSFEQSGILVGLVGSRFERSRLMEYKYMVVTKEQNTEENGYGKNGSALMCQWARFYGLQNFPTYDEALRDTQAGGTRFVALGGPISFFDTEVYRARCEIAAEMFLAEANDRAASAKARAFCHIVAIGASPEVRIHEYQARILLDAYSSAVKRLSLAHVGQLYFSSFDDGNSSSPLSCGGVQNGGFLSTRGADRIQVMFGTRDTAEKLPQCHTGELPWLLVAQYEWHSNSYPGNEYWAGGAVNASTGAAAACCSFLPELQNPDVNSDAFVGMRVKLTPVAAPASDASVTMTSSNRELTDSNTTKEISVPELLINGVNPGLDRTPTQHSIPPVREVGPQLSGIAAVGSQERMGANSADVAPQLSGSGIAAVGSQERIGAYDGGDWAKYCERFEFPNQAYEVGSVVAAVGPMVMRESEELDSKLVRQVTAGQHFMVRARGMGPSGKRLFVTAAQDNDCAGWISCTAQSGRLLLTPVQLAPPVMQNDPSERSQVSMASDAASPTPSHGTQQSVTVSPAPSPGAQQSVPDDNQSYPIGSEAVVLNEVLMRATEDTNNHQGTSADGRWLPGGRRLLVIAHGAGLQQGGTGRRLKVRCLHEGVEGWISCKSQSGRDLIRLLSVSPTPSAHALVPQEQFGGSSPSRKQQREPSPPSKAGAGCAAQLDQLQQQPGVPARATQSSGMDEVDKSELFQYARTIAESLSKGHDEIRLSILRFIEQQGPVLQDNCGAQSNFAPFEFRIPHPPMVEIEQIIVVIALHRKGDSFQVSYKAHCCTDMRDERDCPVENSDPSPAEPPAASSSVIADGLQSGSPGWGSGPAPPQQVSQQGFHPQQPVQQGFHPQQPVSQQGFHPPQGVHPQHPEPRPQPQQPQKEEQTVDPLPFPGFEPTAGFERVDLKYICVDPSGLRLRSLPVYSKAVKAGGEVKAGEVCRICERGKEGGIVWLRLDDGRGWAFERTNRRRMSLLQRQAVDGQQFMLVDPLGSASCSLELAPTPFRSSGKGGTNALDTGARVKVLGKAEVVVQSRKDRFKDETVMFYYVDAGTANPGWLPDEALAHYVEQRPSDGPMWISVLPECSPKVNLAAGRNDKKAEYALSAGDLLEVDLARTTQGVTFFRIKGQENWVCSTLAKTNKPALDLVTIEPHQFLYRCSDKDGAYLRETPTRAKGKELERMLKHRSVVVVTEKATFGSGDVFVYVASPPPMGWTAIAKKDDKDKEKMVCVRPATEMELSVKGNGKGSGKLSGASSSPRPGPQGPQSHGPAAGAYGAPPNHGCSPGPPGAYGAPPNHGCSPGPHGAYGAPPNHGCSPGPPGAYGAPPNHGCSPGPPGAYGVPPSGPPGPWAGGPPASKGDKGGPPLGGKGGPPYNTTPYNGAPPAPWMGPPPADGCKGGPPSSFPHQGPAPMMRPPQPPPGPQAPSGDFGLSNGPQGGPQGCPQSDFGLSGGRQQPQGHGFPHQQQSNMWQGKGQSQGGQPAWGQGCPPQGKGQWPQQQQSQPPWGQHGSQGPPAFGI